MTHSHYFKDVSAYQQIDIYRLYQLWDVTDGCIQHALKKLLCAGQRGIKDTAQDIQEAIDSLERWKAMQKEDWNLDSQGVRVDPAEFQSGKKRTWPKAPLYPWPAQETYEGWLDKMYPQPNEYRP